jgi:hypothetical protein
MFTEKEYNLMADVLFDALLNMKADNDEQEYNEAIVILESALNKLEHNLIGTGYEDENI